MIQLHDEYGTKFSNQYNVDNYNKLIDNIIWPTIRNQYNANYTIFKILLSYFGNEFYYCSLSLIIREPHVCVKHKI